VGERGLETNTDPPIYQYRLWGGRRLADLRAVPLPSGPVGEAGILSDREDRSLGRARGGPQGCIYAGLKTGTAAAGLRLALKSGTVMDHLAEFTPKPGDGIFLRAGTVHALGRDLPKEKPPVNP